jgi:hypothetical protein
MSKWIICYPGGDQRKLAVTEICPGLEYEIADYSLASRNDYPTEEEAVVRARELARTHGLRFIPPTGYSNFLD